MAVAEWPIAEPVQRVAREAGRVVAVLGLEIHRLVGFEEGLKLPHYAPAAASGYPRSCRIPDGAPDTPFSPSLRVGQFGVCVGYDALTCSKAADSSVPSRSSTQIWRSRVSEMLGLVWGS